MSDFVEQCRLEWRRQGVPDPFADEMAADLASDLGEAEAEGVSLEELLGDSAHDPRSFAASWARERGVIPERPGDRGARRRPRFLVAFTALAAIALGVAALLLATGEPRVTVTALGRPPGLLALPAHSPLPAAGRHVVAANASAPVEWILLIVAIVALGFAAWLWTGWVRSGRAGVPA